MITELVLFDVPKGMTREQVVELMRDSLDRWRNCPDLIRKNCIYDAKAGQAGGAYLWPDVASAQRWHDDAWKRRVLDVYGSVPVFRYFETPFVIDNAVNEVVEEATA